MPAKEEPTTKGINWTPIIIGGTALGAIYLITRLFLSRTEQAKEILEDWQQEFDQLQPYVESIYAGGRTPTEQEVAVLSAMLENMRIKEQTVEQLSKSFFTELHDIIETTAKNWWLMPVAIITPIAGYMTYKLVKGWFNNRRPPPNFPCPKCGAVFGTKEALKRHIETEHTPTAQFALEAQENFAQASTWVQNAVAVESYYAKTFTRWDHWSLPEIKNLNWALTSAWVYGIGTAIELSLLRTALMLLLI